MWNKSLRQAIYMCFQLGRWKSTECKDKRKLWKLSDAFECIAARRMYRFSIWKAFVSCPTPLQLSGWMDGGDGWLEPFQSLNRRMMVCGVRLPVCLMLAAYFGCFSGCARHIYQVASGCHAQNNPAQLSSTPPTQQMNRRNIWTKRSGWTRQRWEISWACFIS